MLLEQGFYLGLQLVLRVAPFGFMPLGPQCSLWLSFMSASKHQRSKDNPLGAFATDGDILNANVLNENTGVLVLIATNRLVNVMLENPSGSWYFEYPTQSYIMMVLGWPFIHTWMKLFNHFSPKPTKLTGSLKGLGQLGGVWSKKRELEKIKSVREKLKSKPINFKRAFASRFLKKRYVLAKKKAEKVTTICKNGWSTGGSSLKESGQYTVRFCSRCLEIFEATRYHIETTTMSLPELLKSCPFPMCSHEGPIYETPKKVQAKLVFQRLPAIVPRPPCRPSRFTASEAFAALLRSMG